MSAYARTKKVARRGPGLILDCDEPRGLFCVFSQRVDQHHETVIPYSRSGRMDGGPVVAGRSRVGRAASPFPDKNLEAAIRDVLKHEPKVELTDEKLQNVYFLEAAGKDIKDLTGLEKCKNLAQIKLSKNKISDFKPLKDLTNLQSLDLADNAIKDIGPLANLKGLQYIELSGNQVEKLEPSAD